jgi:putative FmdB family regulatory protein
MPIYNFECPKCFSFEEVVQRLKDPAPVCQTTDCDTVMRKIPTAASFAFVTKGGNLFNFSGAHGRVNHGSKKPAEVGHGRGIGGKKGRKNPTQSEAMKSANSRKIMFP